MSDTRLVVVDDHRMLREGLVGYLDSLAGLRVVGEAADGIDAVEEVRRLAPDVLLTDLQLPRLHGFMVIRKVLSLPEPPAVIAVSMHAEPHYLKQAFAAGALGYVLKEGASQEVVVAIRAVLSGRRYLSEQLRGRIRQDGEAEPLTERQEEVLRLIASGHSTRGIAEELHLSPKTIETHRKHIMEKLELYSVAELTQFAIRIGLIDG